MATITIRVPCLVLSNGKWAAGGSSSDGDPDWFGFEDLCELYEGGASEGEAAKRQFLEATLELPGPAENIQTRVLDAPQEAAE